MDTAPARKPLGIKAYGRIPHLPGSRRGPGDYGLSEAHARIATTKARDKLDRIIVQEKLDGSCVAIARMDGKIVPLIRAGYRAMESHYEQHRLFAAWVFERWSVFEAVLEEGERLCGEWLAQAHGTRYALPHEPFVAFDIMTRHARMPHDLMTQRMAQRGGGIPTPRVIHVGDPMSVQEALKRLESSGHGALDPVEGAVWRVERDAKVDFLGKYVRPDKTDGCYLPEITGKPPVWNWRPGMPPAEPACE